MRMHTRGPAISVLAICVTLAACNATTNPPGQAPVEAALNEPFTVSPGQTAVLSEQQLSVTFLGVLEDSRCPIDVVCMFAGNATMAFHVEQAGAPGTTLNLFLWSDNPQAPNYEGFRIDVQQLTPGRRSDRGIRPADYRAQLLVDRP